MIYNMLANANTLKYNFLLNLLMASKFADENQGKSGNDKSNNFDESKNRCGGRCSQVF